MVPVLFIAAFAATAYGVTKRLGRSGNPVSTYSREDQDAIRRRMAGRSDFHGHY